MQPPPTAPYLNRDLHQAVSEAPEHSGRLHSDRRRRPRRCTVPLTGFERGDDDFMRVDISITAASVEPCSAASVARCSSRAQRRNSGEIPFRTPCTHDLSLQSDRGRSGRERSLPRTASAAHFQ